MRTPRPWRDRSPADLRTVYTIIWYDVLCHLRHAVETRGDPVPDAAPIRQATLVRSDVGRTFDVFVREIGGWWPLRPLSIGGAKVVTVTFEPHLGGRVYETWADGTEVTWGQVRAWDPPAGFTLSWEVLPVVTEVELRFKPLGPALTRVELEHRGWENLTSEQLAEVTALAGGYSAGWAMALDLLRTRLEPDLPEQNDARAEEAPDDQQ
jgi:hypothetical protein